MTVRESQQPQSQDPASDEAAVDEAAVDAPSVEVVDAPPPAPAADPGAEAAPAAGSDPASNPTSGPVFTACLEDGGGCSIINVAVLDEAGETCVEMVVDNCGTFSRAGIPVDTPVTWRLGSASIADLEEECIPAAYDPDSAVVVDGSGSIVWNLETRRPSDLVIDVSLEPASSAAVTSPLAVSGTIPGEVPDCDD